MSVEPEPRPPGFAGFISGGDKLGESSVPSRGGLFDNERLVGDLACVVDVSALVPREANTASTRVPSSGNAGFGTSQTEFWKGSISLDATVDLSRSIDRPGTPILAYVDRASFPGFIEPEQFEERDHQFARDGHDQRLAYWQPQLSGLGVAERALPSSAAAAADAALQTTNVKASASDCGVDEWEKELLEWKRRYGCPEATEEPERPAASVGPTTRDAAETSVLTSSPNVEEDPLAVLAAEVEIAASSWSPPLASVGRPTGDDASASFARGAETAISHHDPDQVGWLTREGAAVLDSAECASQVLSVVQPTAPLPPPGPAPASSRRHIYTKEDLEIATTSAVGRLMPDGTYKTEYTEANLRARDLLVDLRKHRARDKGRQASGPSWVHLAAQAKLVANTLSLAELLECMKLFCSVRYDDYELYMRLLGEVPHYVKLASADQLCELIRLLARRRLRERNYVDMVAAHFLQKIRVTDDNLPARLLVKTANAFAALECRSQPKFVEYFLRHFEHRMSELDGELCCLVSPLLVAQYMSDALRRAYLRRCAETQAGFHGPIDMLRNLACTELVLRKEHHSFVVALPTYVTRYLEKVKQHAAFDSWGAVSLPQAPVPDGPKGNPRSEMSLSLQRKATTATGGPRGDVYNSDMHRDVSACLHHLGIEHENGVLCGPYLLDVVALDMVNPSKRIVYEVNAPHHYYEGTETVLAEKRLRQRLLGRLGQKLHVVHAHEWRALSSAQKMTFMLKLQQAQQEENTKEALQQSAANTARAPLPALPFDAVKRPEPFRLKSPNELATGPIRVPVPPSRRGRLQLTAR